VDAIITREDGAWGAVEIKLGVYDVEKAAHSLLRFKNKIETDKFKPSFLAVIVGVGGVAEKRSDGIYIIPIDKLGI
jgi:hypothetical protein